MYIYISYIFTYAILLLLEEYTKYIIYRDCHRQGQIETETAIVFIRIVGNNLLICMYCIIKSVRKISQMLEKF